MNNINHPIDERDIILERLKTVRLALAQQTEIQNMGEYAFRWETLAKAYHKIDAPILEDLCRKNAERYRALNPGEYLRFEKGDITIIEKQP